MRERRCAQGHVANTLGDCVALKSDELFRQEAGQAVWEMLEKGFQLPAGV